MHLLQIRDRRDLHLDDLDRRDVELHQLMDLSCDMDLMQLAHPLHLDVVQNLDELVRRHRQDVVRLDVQQNRGVENRGVVHQDVQHPLVAEVDVEQRHRLRMDYFLDAVQLVHLEQVVWELQVHLELLHVPQLLMQRQLVQPHVMPLALQDRHRALLRVRQQVLD